jgi:hypothetical protein
MEDESIEALTEGITKWQENMRLMEQLGTSNCPSVRGSQHGSSPSPSERPSFSRGVHRPAAAASLVDRFPTVNDSPAD